MRYLIFLIFFFISVHICAQGSCASPDGPNKEAASAPPDWQWLSDNGYCYTSAPIPAKNITMCFTLTSPGTDIDFNAGLTVSGCAGYGINYARLYTSSPGCVLVDASAIGITTGLTTGVNYTWCISLSGTGPPSCQITSFCPYYIDMTPLPIELIYFECDGKIISWTTASEYNNQYFVLESTNDLIQWMNVIKFNGAGNSSIIQIYSYDVGCNSMYYRLKQVDFDGGFSYSRIIRCNCKEIKEGKFSIINYNILGQEIH